MDRTLYLHIGMNKAGSTSLQRSFHGLETPRLAYFNTGPASHQQLVTNLVARRRGQRYARYWHAHAELDPAVVLEALDAELAEGTRSLVISSEYLCLPHLDAAYVAEVLDGFRPYVDAIRVRAYVREPVAFIRSVVQQRLREHPLSFAPEVYWPRYRARFEAWEAAVGDAALSLVLLSRATLAEGDLLQDFARWLGVPGPVARRDGENQSMGASGFALLWAIHAELDRKGLHTDREARKAWMIEIARAVRMLIRAGRLDAERRFEFAPATCAALRDVHADDIAWIEARIGCRLPTYRPAAGALVFEREADVLDHAAGLGLDLAALAVDGPAAVA